MMLFMFSFKSQNALVTGSSRGIGHAIAITLAQKGAWVAGTATSQAGADHFSKTLSDLKLSGQGFVLDIRDKASIQQLIHNLKILNRLPSILINNAGIVRDALVLRLAQQDWDSVLQVNLTGVFQLTQACLLPMLKARYGRIITIGSVVSASGNKGQAHYAASKAATSAFSKSLALEVASSGITVNVVAPGFIQTDMTNHLNEVQREQIVQKIPLQAWGKPEDIANACMFLASKESAYITGHTLHVNGGLLMK